MPNERDEFANVITIEVNGPKGWEVVWSGTDVDMAMRRTTQVFGTTDLDIRVTFPGRKSGNA